MVGKQYRADEPTERSGQFSEESKSIDSFYVAVPKVSEPAAPVEAAPTSDPYDFDD